MLGVEVAGLLEELEQAELEGAVFGEHGDEGGMASRSRSLAV